MHFILFQHMTHLLCGTALRELCNTNNYDFACPQEPWDRFAFYSAPFDFSNLRDSFFMSWSVKFWFCQGISRGKQSIVSTRDVAGELCWPSWVLCVNLIGWNREPGVLSVMWYLRAKLFLCYRSVDERLVRILLFKKKWLQKVRKVAKV